MSDYRRAFEVADEVADAFRLRDQHRKRNCMSYFHRNDVPTLWDSHQAIRILGHMGMPSAEIRSLLDTKLRSSKKGASNLNLCDKVFLWLHVPSTRDIIRFEDLPAAAQSFLYVRDETLFEETYDPNTTKTRLNRDILKEIRVRKVFSVFFNKIDDENLAKLLHRYPLDVADALRAYRLHSQSKLKARLINIFDCSQMRNQSHLRAFIHSFPWIMSNQTPDMMEASTINRDTWARLIGELDVKNRQYFPAGTGPWARRGIFVKHLKGRNSKPYKDFETGLPVDTDGDDAVK